VNRVSDTVRAAIAAGRTASAGGNAGWRTSAAYCALESRFGECPADCPEAVAALGARLLGDSDWVAGLLAPLLDALAGDPFFEPRLRSNRDPARTGAVLFECPAASLIAGVTDAAAMPMPERVVFTGRMTVTRYVRSGGAVLRRWRAEPLSGDFSAAGAAPCEPLPPIDLADGDVVRADGRSEAHLAGDPRSDMVTLAITARTGMPLMREYRIADGALLTAASADDRASRTEMLLTFLRQSGRADAGPCFEAATRDDAFHLRWAAMREWLGLDARAALPRLAEMAGHDPNTEIRAAATATLAYVRQRLSCPA
jgi:hypothetical protein